MKTKLHFLIILFTFYFFNAFCQQEEARLQQYWNYRDRYKKWFVKIGRNGGESLPVSARNTKAGTNRIYFGDVTASLGDYIAVLATEYKLLKDAGQSTIATLNELYYAINAVYRLDLTAEQHFSTQWPPTLNGFFIRDDVHGNFHQNWQNIYTQSNDPRDDVRNTFSDYAYQNPTLPHPIEDTEMSQDQVIGLLLGFAFVKKLVDPIVVQPTTNDSPRNLVDAVGYLTNLITNQISSRKNDVDLIDAEIGGTTYNIIHGDKNWLIVNPVSNNLVKRGADVTGFSYALAKTAEYINPGNSYESDVDVYFDNNFPFNICPVHFAVESYKIRDYWIDIPSHLAPGFQISSPFNATCLEGSICIAPFLQTPTPLCFPNSVALELVNGTLSEKEYNMNMILSLAASASLGSPHWSQNQIQQASNDHLMPIFDLVYAVLQGITPLNPKSNYEQLLDLAPCQGPYNYRYVDHSYYWTSSIWSHPNYDPNKDQFFYGEYNGNDFMWLYNLYRLAFLPSSSTPIYKNSPCQCSSMSVISNSPLLSPVTIISRFPSYQQFKIAIPEFLTNNVSVEQNGHINMQGDMTLCGGSTLEIKNNGLNVGDPSYANDPSAVLTVRSGSKLWITDNGIVTINPQSKIIIEAGGELKIGSGTHLILEDGASILMDENTNLILEPEAVIELKGPNALFETKGNLVPVALQSGQHLFITDGGASNGGIIKFGVGDLGMLPGSELVVTGCKVFLNDVELTYQNNAIFKLEKESSLVDVHHITNFYINNGETLIVTKGNAISGGTLKLNSGEFNIYSNGHVLSDHCKILLNEYNIHYYQDADITLNGSEATFQFGNYIFLQPNADLHFTGNGYFKFKLAQNFVSWINLYGDASNTITITGNDPTDKIIDVVSDTWVHPSDPIRRMILRNGTIYLGEHSVMTCGQPYEFADLNVTGDYTWRGGGLWVGAQSDHFINNVNFTNLEYGLRAYLMWCDGHSSLRMTNSTFTRCGTGLKVIDRGFNLSNVIFEDCDWGIDAIAMSAPSKINSSTFSYMHNNSIRFSGSGFGTLYMYNNYISDGPGQAYNLDFTGSTLNLECNTFENNDGVLRLGQNGNLNASSVIPPFKAGNNVFTSIWGAPPFNPPSYLSGLTTAIDCDDADHLYLMAGHNDFSVENGLILEGNINSNCNLQIDCSNNKWYTSNLNGPVSFTTTNSSSCYDLWRIPNAGCSAPTPVHITINDFNPQGPGTCLDHPSHDPSEPLEICNDCPIIYTAHFSGLPLNQALMQALQKSEADCNPCDNSDDLLAIDMFTEIIQQANTYDYENVRWIKDLAYSKLKESLGNAVKNNRISEVALTNYYIDEVINMQYQLLNLSKQYDNDVSIRPSTSC